MSAFDVSRLWPDGLRVSLFNTLGNQSSIMSRDFRIIHDSHFCKDLYQTMTSLTFGDGLGICLVMPRGGLSKQLKRCRLDQLSYDKLVNEDVISQKVLRRLECCIYNTPLFFARLSIELAN